MISQQLRDWLASVVAGDIFASREKLIALLAENSPHEALEQEFREFFNGYYVLVLELEEYEESVLGFINGNDAFSHLKHRVSAVEAQRKSSPLGREARRMGMSIHNVSSIKHFAPLKVFLQHSEQGSPETVKFCYR